MAYTITQPPSEPIFVVKVMSPFDAQLGPIQIMHDAGKLIGRVTGLFYVIYDIREWSLTFPDIVKGLVSSFRSEIPELGVMKARGRMIVVGAGTLVELGAKSAERLRPDQPGIKVCNTVEEALAYAREQLAKAT